MNYKNVKKLFLKKCEKNGLTVFEAEMEYGTDSLYLKEDDFFQFCSINNLKTVFVSTIYDDEHQEASIIDPEAICKRLSNFFDNHLEKSSNYYFFDNITKDYYKPILDDILKAVREELNEHISNMSQFDDSNLEETILFINASTIFNGLLVSTHVYEIDDVEANDTIDNSFSIKDFMNKYAQIIVNRINNHKFNAVKENMRINQEKRAIKFEEIKDDIEREMPVSTLETQKLRNEYADRIYSKLRMQDGYDWLTKKAIRECVEQVYYSRTSFNPQK